MVIFETWKDRLKKCICTVGQLKKYIDITDKEERVLKEVVGYHPMRITEYYISLINRKDKNDPIRKLIVPSVEELAMTGSYDTSGEQKSTKMSGLQHKYSQTALILLTNQCAAYCRFCFRKRLVGLSTKEILQKFHNVLGYIKKHKEINNVLISGGDPLVLPTKTIQDILKSLFDIPHLNFVRIGSRIPVTFPARILKDRSLSEVLKRYSAKDKRIYLVTHFNHPGEITESSTDAIDRLIKSNIIISNQTVLLKGVNDKPEVLANLLNKLVSIGVNPYYVFQCRPVRRVKSYFQVPILKGIKVVEEAKKKLNGHSKRFKYVMSHDTGKIEIVGILEGKILFKYHQARNPKNLGKIFTRKLDKKSGWL
jgi:KamA family protein